MNNPKYHQRSGFNLLEKWAWKPHKRQIQEQWPRKKQQKALPYCIISIIALNQTMETRTAISQLAIAGWFFACQSCEYLQVPESQQCQTRLLTVQNITFQKDGKIIPHSSPLLTLADCISVTFEYQKNNDEFETITQWKTNHKVMFPVKSWANIVQQIQSYPKKTNRNVLYLFQCSNGNVPWWLSSVFHHADSHWRRTVLLNSEPHLNTSSWI